jgi:pSer/pThr/pTyr-binding forkhead associated (FHA) protein
MARLHIKTAGLENQSIELRLGVNRVGRSPDADFQIVHPTISSLHCELVLTDGGVILRDLESTNGTFVEGKPVREATLVAGQTIHLGDVELLVENTDARVAIPKFVNPEAPPPAPIVVPKDGAVMCPKHTQTPVTHQCTVCKEVMCEACVHRLRRKGGKFTLLLCPTCSNAVEPIGGPQKKKKSLLSRVGETVKLKFTRALHIPPDES